jgi:hypothetical protein
LLTSREIARTFDPELGQKICNRCPSPKPESGSGREFHLITIQSGSSLWRSCPEIRLTLTPSFRRVHIELERSISFGCTMQDESGFRKALLPKQFPVLEHLRLTSAS